MKQITKLFLFIFILAAAVPTSVTHAQEAQLPGFDAGKLIEDSVFSDKSTFGGPEGIQKFLESKKSILANTSPEFLAKLKEPTSVSLKTTVEDPRPSLERLRTAAELIWDVAQSSGINPQVILVTLNKEQSLVTGRQSGTPEQIQRALDFSMGFGCPDNSPCGELYRGFYYQIFGNVDTEGNRYLGAARSLMKSFQTPRGRGPFYNGAVSKVGDTIILGNTLGGYAGVQAQQTITIGNSATAALYRYTPHVYNGNYNFWKFMTQWFRYPNGTILKAPNNTVYIIQNGARLTITDFVSRARNINTSNAALISFTEMDQYPEAGTYGLPDNTVVSEGGKFFVFINNKKYPASEFILQQRGLSIATAIAATAADLAPYPTEPELTPAEGSVLRGINGPAVYVVENNVLRLVSWLVFQQRGLAGQVKLIPDDVLATYQKGGFVAPANGTLIRSPSVPTVFLVVERIKRPMTASVFKTYGFKYSQVFTISDDEMNALPAGSIAEPKDQTYYKVNETGELYIYKNNSKHFVSTFVAKQRGITPDFGIPNSEHSSWPEGNAIVPKDGTVVKGTNPTVYIVENGKLLALSGADFTARKLSFSKVVNLPQAEVDKYSKGSGGTEQ